VRFYHDFSHFIRTPLLYPLEALRLPYFMADFIQGNVEQLNGFKYQTYMIIVVIFLAITYLGEFGL